MEQITSQSVWHILGLKFIELWRIKLGSTSIRRRRSRLKRKSPPSQRKLRPRRSLRPERSSQGKPELPPETRRTRELRRAQSPTRSSTLQGSMYYIYDIFCGIFGDLLLPSILIWRRFPNQIDFGEVEGFAPCCVPVFVKKAEKAKKPNSYDLLAFSGRGERHRTVGDVGQCGNIKIKMLLTC